MPAKKKQARAARRGEAGELVAPPQAVFGEELFANSPFGYVVFDERAIVTDLNPTAAQLLGLCRETLVGLPFTVALHSDEVALFYRHLHQCRTNQSRPIVSRLRLGKAGPGQVPVELSSVRMAAVGGWQYPTAIIDLREREAHLKMMREGKELAEQLFEFVPHPLVALDDALMIRATNSAFRQKFNARPDELYEHYLPELEFVDWRSDHFLRAMRRVARSNEPLSELAVECSLRGSGKRLALLASALRLAPVNGVRVVILLTFEDITHRRRQEQERETMLRKLRELNAELEQRVHLRTAELNTANEQLKAQSQRVLQAQEAERRHLARELHDEVGQALTGLNMLLHRAGDEAASAARGEIREARRVISDLLKRVRQMSIDLRPAVLDDLGVFVAVRSHIDTFSKRTGIRVNFECGPVAEESISPEVKITVFRCVQEALTNIVRHAHTRRASVALRADPSRLLLEVMDQGQGFDPGRSMENSSSGLNGMRERVALAGGQLELETAPGHGTRVRVKLPLRAGGEKISR